MKIAATYTALLLLLALLCTSCIYSDGLLNGIITAKSTWFFLATGAVLIFSAVTFFSGTISFKLNKLDIAIGFFFAYVILNNTFHDRQFLSLKNAENFGLLISYLFGKQVFSSKQFIYQVFTAVVLLFTLSQIIVAVLQWFEYLPSLNYNYKFSGFFFNPSPFVISLSALMVYCLVAFFYNSNRAIKIAGLIIFLLGLPVVIITLSRAAWLGLLCGVILIIALKFKLFKRVKVSAASVVIALAGIALIIFSTYYLYHLKKDSADGRVLVWKIASRMVHAHPLTGFGQGGLHGHFLKYQSSYFKTHPDRIPIEGRLADQVAYAFNDLLQITIEQGLIGLLLFLLILMSCVSVWRAGLPHTGGGIYIGAAAAILVIMVSGLFSYPMVMLPVQVVFYLSLGILSSSYTVDIQQDKIRRIQLMGFKKWGIAIACFIAGGFYIFYAMDVYTAYKQAYLVKDNGGRIQPVQTLAPYNYILRREPMYILLQGDELLSRGKINETITMLENAKQITTNKQVYYALANLYTYQKNYVKAEEQYLFVIYALPGLLKPQYLLAKFYYNTGQTAKWRQQAQQIIIFKPKVPSNDVTGMQAEIQGLIAK